MASSLPGFWCWFLAGAGGRAGYRRLVNRWLVLHVVVGAALATLVDLRVEDVAEKALIPLLAILVGLTFSWAGNAHALLQSDEIIELANNRDGGIAEYIFTFQLCILVILVTIACWVIPSLQLPYLLKWLVPQSRFDRVAACVLYALVSLAVRTSWQAVLGANMLLLSRVRMLTDRRSR